MIYTALNFHRFHARYFETIIISLSKWPRSMTLPGASLEFRLESVNYIGITGNHFAADDDDGMRAKTATRRRRWRPRTGAGTDDSESTEARTEPMLASVVLPAPSLFGHPRFVCLRRACLHFSLSPALPSSNLRPYQLMPTCFHAHS